MAYLVTTISSCSPLGGSKTTKKRKRGGEGKRETHAITTLSKEKGKKWCRHLGCLQLFTSTHEKGGSVRTASSCKTSNPGGKEGHQQGRGEEEQRAHRTLISCSGFHKNIKNLWGQMPECLCLRSWGCPWTGKITKGRWIKSDKARGPTSIEVVREHARGWSRVHLGG